MSVLLVPDSLRIASGLAGLKTAIHNAFVDSTMALTVAYTILSPDSFTSTWSPTLTCRGAGLLFFGTVRLYAIFRWRRAWPNARSTARNLFAE
jgi:hypothetical protein